jgi:hypothetical protein
MIQNLEISLAVAHKDLLLILKNKNPKKRTLKRKFKSIQQMLLLYEVHRQRNPSKK